MPDINHPPLRFGLSWRLLVLTALVVLTAELLIWAPSISRFRVVWLTERIEAAGLAVVALEAAPDGMLSDDLRDTLLHHAGLRGVVLHRPGQRLLALSEAMPAAVDVEIDLDEAGASRWIWGALTAMSQRGNRVLRVMGPSDLAPHSQIEVLLDESPLRAAMYDYSRRILLLSLFISIATGTVVYAALQWLMVRPMRRLAASMQRFRKAPEEFEPPSPEPTRRRDEIGVVERELTSLQTQVQALLRQKHRLAALGAAVAKINHDLRNSLATAMIASDSLARSDDPDVQQVTPRLMEAIDHAVTLCRQTLDYASDSGPRLYRQWVCLYDLVEEASALLMPLDPKARQQQVWHNQVPDTLELYADRDHLVRVLTNLARNAFAAGAQSVTVSAAEDPRTGTWIEVADDGPGLPQKAQDNLFKPFQGSARRGGTGLGLVIARDLMVAHGGEIALAKTDASGATFRLTLPQPEIEKN